MTAKAKMTDLVLQVRVENGTKADGKAAVKNINFNQLKLDATDQQLLDAGSSEQEIMGKLKISRATFYRYKRSINN